MNFTETRRAIRLLIFDLDGTLIDSKTDLALSVNATLRFLGRKPLEDETIYSYVGQGAEALIQRAIGDGFSPEEVARGLPYFIGYYGQHKLDHTTLYPGVREALERLASFHKAPRPGPLQTPEASPGKNRLRYGARAAARGRGRPTGDDSQRRTLAVLTNKPARVSRDILEELGLLPLFRYVYGGNSFESKKPDPVGVYTLLEETGVPPHEAMVVGDSDVDILTGANAGVWTCGVTYGFGTLQLDSHPPDLVVHSLAELADALEAGISLRRSE